MRFLSVRTNERGGGKASIRYVMPSPTLLGGEGIKRYDSESMWN